jgi:hypothetical protein
MGENRNRFSSEDAMNELSHCVAMASICRARAFEDKERREEWLSWAEIWNQLPGEGLRYPLEETEPRTALVT